MNETKIDNTIYDNEKIYNELLNKISDIVDKIITSEEIYRKIDKEEFLEDMSKVIRKSIQEKTFDKIQINEKIIRQLMALQLVSGMLADLDKDKLAEFDNII